MDMKNVLSWGLGLQSTVLGVMSALGELPRLDLIITADTQWETKQTNEIEQFYKKWYVSHGLDVVTVTGGSVMNEGAKEHVHIPFFTSSGAPLNRQCTRHFKISPINRYLREWLGYPASVPPHPPPGSVRQWLGFTIDERQRVKASRVKWLDFSYPLIASNFARWDCIDYLESKGLPVPSKSACIGCPYRSAFEWQDMKANNPDDFLSACKFDEDNRHNPLVADGVESPELYVWRGLIPLADVDFNTLAERDRRQIAQMGFNLGDDLIYDAGSCNSGYCWM